MAGAERNVAAFSETRRQLVHVAMGGFAFLLRFLTWWEAAAVALVALFFNLLVLPRVAGHALFRPADLSRGVATGIVLYPLAVLLLILIFPHRLDIVAAAWAILAAGDGCATLAGRAVGSPRLPWNPEKSVAGLLAFVVCGSLAGMLLAWWVRPAIEPRVPWLFVWLAPPLAAVLAAGVESMPVRLDDNIRVPATAGVVLWALSLLSGEAWVAARPQVGEAWLPGLAVNLTAALAALLSGAVSRSGAVGGAVLGVLIYASTGLGGWLLLLSAFVGAAAASRIGLKRKTLLGIAEDRGGRRGAGNALANCGLATSAALLSVLSPYREACLLAFVTALVAGGSDTVASEVGKAWGRHTFVLPGITRVRPGTPGGISLEGTAAGLAAAFGLTAVALAAGLTSTSALWIVVVAATTGSFVESMLGATLEAPGILNNDLLNFINTSVAAAAALGLAWSIA